MSPPKSSAAEKLDTPAPISSKERKPEVREAPVQTKKRSPKRPLIILGVLFVVVVGGIGVYSLMTANQETTDDAQVEADIVPVGARTGGQVQKVLVTDNQHVKKGELLVELDRETPQAKVTQAEAELETAKANADAADASSTVSVASAKGGLTSARASVSTSAEAVTTAHARVKAAEAAKKRAEAEARRTALSRARTQELFSRSAVSQQELDNAIAADDAAKAGVDLAQAELEAAKQNERMAKSQVSEARGRLDQSTPIDSRIAVAKAQATLAHARVKSATAALELAKLQLSYTRIEAPADGIVSRLSVHVGQLVQPGQPIAEFVPTATYVVANFKETQIARIKAGDRAVVELDAFPGREFEGTVESLSAATGARFSLIPPDNAPGNFVKVVQRVPVRVHWKGDPGDIMRAGLSAEVTVHVK